MKEYTFNLDFHVRCVNMCMLIIKYSFKILNAILWVFTGEVQSSESLFYYDSGNGGNGLGLANNTISEAIPCFVDENDLTNMASSVPNLITTCGGNEQCLFDGVVTGDVEIAFQTLSTQQMNEDNAVTLSKLYWVTLFYGVNYTSLFVQLLGNRPPIMNGSDTLFASVYETTVYSFTATDANDNFTVTLQGNLPPTDEFTFSPMGSMYNFTAYTFTWTPTSTQNVSIQFLAVDSVATSTLLHPLVILCACNHKFNATCTDGHPGEDKFLLQNCDCGLGEVNNYSCLYLL